MLQALQRTNGWKDDEKVARCVLGKRIGWAYPFGLELLGLVSHRLLALWHAGDQKRHVKAPRQVTVGDPMGEHKNVSAGQGQAARLALRGKRRFSVQRGNVGGGDIASIGMARQQYAKFFKTFPNGCNSLRQVQVTLGRPAGGLAVCRTVCGINAATRKHVSARRKAGGHGTARHQHFDAVLAIAQQQNGGGGAQCYGFSRRLE